MKSGGRKHAVVTQTCTDHFISLKLFKPCVYNVPSGPIVQGEKNRFVFVMVFVFLTRFI